MDRYETSLTKGSFAYKPARSKKGKLSNVFSYAKMEFQLLWEKIEKEIQKIDCHSYQETFDNILMFIQNSIKVPMNTMNEIPAAVLQMGVNMPDHSNIFKRLGKLLRSKDNYTVILESRKCHNFSSTLQIMHQELQKQLDSDKLKSSPRKRSCLINQKKLKPIILLIQDVETFSTDLLEEIILNCRIYLGKLPIVLVFGMSSAMVTLHNILRQKVLCHLGIETFYAFSATEYLTRIIEEVIMSPLQPFKLGPKVFRLIIDTVLYHDFSVTNLSHLLRFSVMEHFCSNKAAILCCSESEIEKRVHSLKSEELQYFNRLPSMELYKENNPDIASNLSSPSALKSLFIELILNLFSFQNTMIISLKVLHYLTKDLPGSPLGKQFREIYSLNLEKQIYLTSGFKEAEKFLKFQSQNDLLEKLKTCLEFLSSFQMDTCKELIEIIEKSIDQLMNLTSDDFEKNIFEKPYQENEMFSSRFELQEKMRSSIKLKRSKFETVRNEIIESVLCYFKFLQSPLHLPLHEIFFFDNVNALKRHIMPAPRVVLCHALSNPHEYLQCKCCKIMEHEEFQSSMPDLCVLYKLHLECGKLINLCDWLEAFKSIKSKDKELKKRKSKSTDNDSSINIRFLHTASELQLLGFIKPTKRKTDHVARLTFGIF